MLTTAFLEMINIPFAKVKALSSSAGKKKNVQQNAMMDYKRKEGKTQGNKHMRNKQMYTSQ